MQTPTRQQAAFREQHWDSHGPTSLPPSPPNPPTLPIHHTTHWLAACFNLQHTHTLVLLLSVSVTPLFTLILIISQLTALRHSYHHYARTPLPSLLGCHWNIPHACHLNTRL